MIKEIKIENFKSIESLNLELGRLNVFIGANGSGKSNILEGIGMGCAAVEDKLDDAFLSNRGIRVSSPIAMRSGFSNENSIKPISITFKHNIYRQITFKINNLNSYYSPWNLDKTFFEQFIKTLQSLDEGVGVETVSGQKIQLKGQDIENHINQMNQKTGKKNPGIEGFSDFMIFAPENKYLRTFADEGQIKPLGIRGEGLFKYLSVILKDKKKKEEIVGILDLFDWFEDFEIPNNLEFGEKRLDVKDRFLKDGLKSLDQTSVNEGFLYALFYALLFIGDAPTPKFFAIDNIDNAMNPKMGNELVHLLAKLAKKHDKQVILTTHNPSVLDGLDLSDDDQRLFVISRNKKGHTQALRVPHRESDERLSYRFIRGSIGGLPKNF